MASYFDPDKMKTAATHAATAAEKADGAHTYIMDISDDQDTAKWGTQPGPTAFATAYSRELTSLEQTVKDLQKQTADFATNMRQLANTAEDADSNAATDMQRAQQGITTPPQYQPTQH